MNMDLRFNVVAAVREEERCAGENGKEKPIAVFRECVKRTEGGGYAKARDTRRTHYIWE